MLLVDACSFLLLLMVGPIYCCFPQCSLAFYSRVHNMKYILLQIENYTNYSIVKICKRFKLETRVLLQLNSECGDPTPWWACEGQVFSFDSETEILSIDDRNGC